MTIRKSVWVAKPVEVAFSVFTAEINRWWPLRHYSYGGERAQELRLEGRVGGRLFERFSDGEEFVIGTVSAFEAPRRVVFTWKDPSWSDATEVEVRFAAESGGTRVDLEHRGWERVGDSEELRRGFASGWESILQLYAAAVSGS